MRSCSAHILTHVLGNEEHFLCFYLCDYDNFPPYPPLSHQSTAHYMIYICIYKNANLLYQSHVTVRMCFDL